LVIPARRATLRTIHPAPCRSSRRPSAAAGLQILGEAFDAGAADSEQA